MLLYLLQSYMMTYALCIFIPKCKSILVHVYFTSVCTRLISLYTDTFGIIVSRISYGFVTYQPLIFQVRNLKWLGFRVPLAIVNKAHQANQLYPFAISLIESVRTYERTCEKVK